MGMRAPPSRFSFRTRCGSGRLGQTLSQFAFPRWIAGGAALLFATSTASSVVAAPERRIDFPCKGCLFVPPPEGATKSALLVVLHGDAPFGKTPLVARDAEPFVGAASERGIAVLAPMCPKEEGCLVGSFWQWSKGDPVGWMAAQVDAVCRESSIDPERIWIAGWSGGASFLGYHYARLGERYAAVILAGGGMPPLARECSSCTVPAYFLVGDKNPLHHLARGSRDAVEACTKDVAWDLVHGMDHGGEWRALNAKGKVSDLLDWLATRRRNCPQASEKSPLPVVVPSSLSSAIPEPAPLPEASPRGSAHCGCNSICSSESAHHLCWLLGAVLALVLRRHSFVHARRPRARIVE